MTAADGESPRILITNAEQRSMLASCRCLATAGYRVSAIAFARRAAAHGSRCCERRLHMTDPGLDAERFVQELVQELAHGRRGGYAALIPGSDTALLTISRAREDLEAYTHIGLPPHEVVERSLDREALSAAATAAGLAAPDVDPLCGRTGGDVCRTRARLSGARQVDQHRATARRRCRAGHAEPHGRRRA